MTFHSNGVLDYFSKTNHSVAPKVYWFVFNLRDENKETTLAEIGKFAGCSRSSTSRALRYLRRIGVVEYRRTGTGLMFTSVKEDLS